MSDPTHPRIEPIHDGELSGHEAARAEAHVSGCVECQRALAAMRALDAALGEPMAAIPVGFARATRAMVLRRRAPEAPLWWLALPAPVRTGLVALLFLAAAAGVRFGETITAKRSEATELSAALDAPATDAMLALHGAEVQR